MNKAWPYSESEREGEREEREGERGRREGERERGRCQDKKD